MFGKKLEANGDEGAKGREAKSKARDKGVVHLSQKGLREEKEVNPRRRRMRHIVAPEAD